MRISKQVGFANTVLTITISAIGIAMGAYIETALTLSGVLCAFLAEIVIDLQEELEL